MTSPAPSEPPCGPGADARYCPQFWELTSEVERLHGLIRELLEDTGLDDDEQAEWLERAGIPAEPDAEGAPS